MGAILDYPIGYRGLVLNDQRGYDGALLDKDDDCILVELFDFSRLQIRDQREGLHLLTGGDLGVATEVFRYISIRGRLTAPNDRGDLLEDKAARLGRAFDIEEAQLDSPSTVGVSALDFYTPTATPPAGHTALVHEMFLCRPAASPAIYQRRSGGQSLLFAVELVTPNPKRLLYDPTRVDFSASEGWGQFLPNWTTDQGRVVYPLVTVVTSGNGAANFSISQGPQSLVLDLSSTGGAATFTIDCQTGVITRANGNRADHWRTSSVAAIPLGVPAGGAQWNIGHVSNVTSVSAVYNQARW